MQNTVKNTFKNEVNVTGPTVDDLLKTENELSSEDIAPVIDESDASLSNMKLLIRDIYQFPLLTASEEVELSHIIHEGGEGAEEARQRFINSNLRLAVHYAKKYRGLGVEFDDLVVMGILGIITAVDKFDGNLGFRFCTYASWWIKDSITKGIAHEGRAVHLPSRVNNLLRKVEKAKKTYYQQYHSEPSVMELAAMAGVSEAQVLSALHTLRIFDVEHYDETIANDEVMAKVNRIADENAVDPFEVVAEQDLISSVRKAMEILDDREKTVIMFRFGFVDGRVHSLEEIANMPELNVSRERVRQVQEKACSKMRRIPALAKLFNEYAA